MQNKTLLKRTVRKLSALLLSIFLLLGTTRSIYAEAYNPYGGGWSNCTWSAWQLVYEATGIALPGWHSAAFWYDEAAASGFSVGQEPRANSVGVWYGHVVYVSAVDENGNIYVKEGGFAGGYNEGWADGYSARYGQALLGYIYLDGPASEVDYSYQYNPDAKTADQPIRNLEGQRANVQMAIAPELQDADIENLELEIIKKYDDVIVEENIKDEEKAAMKDVQAEDAKVKRVTLNISSPLINITSKANPVTTAEPTK